jgi:phosphohistidine swiveling domain-containing protein
VRAWGHFRDGLGARLAAISLPGADDPRAWQEAWQQLDALTEEFLCLHRWSIVLADYAYNAFLLATGLLPRKLREGARKGLLARVRLVTANANAARATYTHGSGTDFLSRYGHRSASLDYATPTWVEELTGKPWAAPDTPEPEDGTTRPKAGTLVRLLEMREEQRFHWERILARQRALLVSAGHVLHRQGLLAAPDQVWWMEWSELVAALETGSPPDPAGLARRRRAHRIHVPVRRPTHLCPADMDPDESSLKEPGYVLRGVGASSGVATGIAVVYPTLTDLPSELPEGCILVLPCLDPAWTPVLRQVAGLVIERGGLLSHAAIIAREYSIPLVIGVLEATERIETGKMVELDGDRGTVTMK